MAFYFVNSYCTKIYLADLLFYLHFVVKPNTERVATCLVAFNIFQSFVSDVVSMILVLELN